MDTITAGKLCELLEALDEETPIHAIDRTGTIRAIIGVNVSSEVEDDFASLKITIVTD